MILPVFGWIFPVCRVASEVRGPSDELGAWQHGLQAFSTTAARLINAAPGLPVKGKMIPENAPKPSRLPFQATLAAVPYDAISPLPVAVLLDNVRSMYNVGAFFRTADAAALSNLYLAGITAIPPKKEITKTALGADLTVPWKHWADPIAELHSLRAAAYEIAVIETSVHAVDLFDWTPRFPVCLIFGHEVEGVREELTALADTHVRIPMLGTKHSLNVATSGGVVIYELLRKYRRLMESTASPTRRPDDSSLNSVRSSIPNSSLNR